MIFLKRLRLVMWVACSHSPVSNLVVAINEQINHVSNLVLFARIVQAGGIARCAADLGVERTTVSRRLRNLEREMGVKLLVRSSKRITPTRAGRRCFERCVKILDLVGEISLLGAVEKRPSRATKISIAATPDIVDHFLEQRLVAFEKSHSSIEIRRVLYSESNSTPLERADLLVTWKSNSHNSGLARKLLAVDQAFYASPAYLSRFGRPDTPADLPHHTSILEDSNLEGWNMTGPNGSVRIRLQSPLITRDLLECRESAIAGFGLCQLPCYLGDPFVHYGRLVRVLPDYKADDRMLVTISPRHSNDELRVTMLRVALEESFSSGTDSEVPVNHSNRSVAVM